MANRPGTNMPAAEIDITPELVSRLLADQHPDLATRPLSRMSNGWDNVMFRVMYRVMHRVESRPDPVDGPRSGEDLVVRLPRRSESAELVRNEQRWLPVIGPDLPLPTPIPVRTGRPTDYYPWSWSVLPWLPGTPVGLGARPRGPEAAPGTESMAVELGRFLAALHRPAPDDAPDNPVRGGPLAGRDHITRERIDALAGVLDREEILRRWRHHMAQPPWTGPPLWIHGDLHTFNLLQVDGRLSAVIDFGDITAGDPATDLAVAFSMFDGPARETFRRAAGTAVRPIDDAMWSRAEGWALSVGLAIMGNSADNPDMYRLGRRMVGY